MRKDDFELEEDDEEESDEEGDGEGDSEGGDFDAKHPRWPGGSPDGTGGEFRPKDGGGAMSDIFRQAYEDANSTGGPRASDTYQQAYLDPNTPEASQSHEPTDSEWGVVREDYIGSAAVGLLAAETGIVNTAARISSVIRDSAHNLFSSDTSDGLPKPEGIPDNWIEKPSQDGRGMEWINPENSNDRVRVMPADPDAKFSSQQQPYVIDQNGGYLDVNGNIIPGSNPRQTSEAHIPYTQFKFKR